MGLDGALCRGLGGMEGMGCCQTDSCEAGAPSGGSHHFLPLWEHESIALLPHLYLGSSQAQRQGVIPLPHLHAGKVPLWAALDTA